MKIPLLDLKKQYKSIEKEINDAIKKVVDSQLFIMGEEVELLEKLVASYCGTKHAIGVASGTDALLIALKAAGIKEGDEVITTPFTFIATAEAISNAGAIPVFADIDDKSYNLDPSLIEAKITQRTKAILPVHLYGQPADMDGVTKVARKHGLKVIEDCAQAIGATCKSTRAQEHRSTGAQERRNTGAQERGNTGAQERGSMRVGSIGDAGCISFFPSKNLGAFGDGGMIVTSDDEIREKALLLRLHGSSRRYMHPVLGYNSRLDTLQAAVLNVKLKYLDGWASKRKRNAEFLNNALKDLKGVATPYVYPRGTHVYHQYVLKVESGIRDRLIEFLGKKGIESRVYYPVPLHAQECYAFLGHKDKDFPVSLNAAFSTLALPVFPELTAAELEYIAGTVKEFFESWISRLPERHLTKTK